MAGRSLALSTSEMKVKNLRNVIEQHKWIAVGFECKHVNSACLWLEGDLDSQWSITHACIAILLYEIYKYYD